MLQSSWLNRRLTITLACAGCPRPSLTPHLTKVWAPARPLISDVSPACLCVCCALAVGQAANVGQPLSRRRRWGWGIGGAEAANPGPAVIEPALIQQVCEWADVARRRIRGEAPWAPRSPLAPPADVPAPCPADSSAPRQGAHCCGSASEGACGPGAAKPDLKHSTAGDAGGPQPPVPQLPLGGFWPTPPASPVRRLMSTDSMATMYFDCDEDFHDASEDIEPERVPSTTAAPLLPGGTAAVVVAAPTRGAGPLGLLRVLASSAAGCSAPQLSEEAHH